MKEARIYLLLFIAVLAISTSAVLVKVSDAPAGVIAFYRMFFAFLFMIPVFIKKYVRELALITKRDWFFCVLSGIFLAFHFILWFESLNFTSVASSTVLVTLQPIFAFIGTYIFFKEVLSIAAILSGITAVAGSVVIAYGDFSISGSALWGDILALAACALITFYLMFGQSVRKRVSLISYTFIVYGFSAFMLYIYVWISGDSFLPYDRNEWIIFILLALVPTLMGHSLLNLCLKWVSTSTISVAILLEPVGAAALAYFMLGEVLSWSQVAGGVIVLAGILLFIFSEQSMKNVEKKRMDPSA